MLLAWQVVSAWEQLHSLKKRIDWGMKATAVLASEAYLQEEHVARQLA